MALSGAVLGFWLAGWLQFAGTLAPFAAAYLLAPFALWMLADFLPRRVVH